MSPETESRRLSIPSGALQLEAVLHVPGERNPRGLVVVCHPHPLYGGSMDNNVVAALCEAALQEGMSALRFNFRGVGASGGKHDNGDAEQLDVLAALAFAAELPGGNAIGLAGYSFGAATASAACFRSAAVPGALVLVSPPLRSADPARYRTNPISRLLIAGDSDQVCPAEMLEFLAAELTPTPTLAIVEGADHSWLGYESELRDIAAGFLRWHLAVS